MHVTIEPCASAQQPGWLDLRHALWPEHARDELAADLAPMIAQPQRYAQFIAYGEARQPVGLIEISVRSDYVNGTSSSPVAFVEGLYVAPDRRRRGVARALVAAAMAWARQRGLAEIASDVLLDNLASQAAHRALGFEETDRVVYYRRSID
jgi:aminoglycoside 6'-N-acetyltransferase I